MLGFIWFRIRDEETRFLLHKDDLGLGVGNSDVMANFEASEISVHASF